MKKKNTYKPEDIEELLLHKSFEELLEEEKEFVLTHVESEMEYKELRGTLLSIKYYSQNQNQIMVADSVKEELMKKMEQKKSRFGWFHLNSIGVFLFPADTSWVKKPGFQFATLAILFAFVLNFGLNMTEQNNSKEISDNILTKEEKGKLEKNKLEELLKEENENSITEVNKSDVKKNKETDVQVKELTPEKITELPKPDEKVDIMEDANITLEEIAVSNKEEELRAVSFVKDKVSNIDVTLSSPSSSPNLLFKNQNQYKFRDSLASNRNGIRGGNNIVNTGSGTYGYTTDIEDDKSGRNLLPSYNSQSLESSEEVIDLLFVAM